MILAHRPANSERSLTQLKDPLTYVHRRQKLISLLGDPRTKWSAAVLIAVVLLVAGIVMVKNYVVRSVDDQAIATDVIPQPTGLPGYPGSTGWKLLDLEKSSDQISVTVHHVIASHYGIYAVYSVKAKSPKTRLDSASVIKHIADGKMTTDPTTDFLLGTDGRAAVHVASLGKPVPGVLRHGMNVAVDTDKGTADLSLDVVEGETPGVVAEGVSFMTNPEAANLHHGGYSGGGPQGVTFGVHPGSVITTDSTTSHFMISPDGAIREITFEELVAFNKEQIPKCSEGGPCGTQ